MDDIIKIYKEEDYDKLRDFVIPWNSKGIYDLSNLMDKNFLKWYYSSSLYCWLTYREEEGKIKGIVGIEKIPFIGGNSKKDFILIKDVYAIQGYGGGLIKDAMKMSNYVGGLGISQKAKQIYYHFGWNDVPAKLEKYTFYLKLQKNKFVNFSYSVIINIFSIYLKTLQYFYQYFNKINFVEIKKFTKRDSNYIRIAVESYGNTLSRDIEYLNWRFNTNNNYIKYHIYKINVLNKEIGYIIVGIQKSKGSATISDLLVPEHYIYLSSVIIRHAILIAYKNNLRRLTMICSLPGIKKALTKNLFFKRKFEDDFMLTNYSDKEFKGNWNIATGFSDIDFYT